MSKNVDSKHLINDDYDDDKASFIVKEAIDDINNKHTIQKL